MGRGDQRDSLPMIYYVLVDCNNFYVSCERLFNPKLEKEPVIVLSNNDGCVVARSNEAKKLNIKMGEPFFKIKEICEALNVKVFSSNYPLYGDLSRRIMNLLRAESPEIEVYSIDEAFLKYSPSLSPIDLFQECLNLKMKVEKWVGIPLSFGIAPTKTLAKIANDLAKKDRKIGVFNFSCKDLQNEILKEYPISDVWGIGKGFSQRLNNSGIYTAWDFKESDPILIRKKMGVVGERILWELRGISCLPICLPAPKKSITSSRSFGRIVTEQEELAEALSCFVSQACVKLRAQNSCASAIYVYLEAILDVETGLRQTFGFTQKFSLETNYTPQIIAVAKEILLKIYVKNRKYKKCGIILLDIIDEKNVVRDLLLDGINPRMASLMSTIDSINAFYGKDKIIFGAAGIHQNWKTRHDRSSTHNTTSCLPVVKC